MPAGLARKLGSHILTETMDARPDLGLDSYDRFFPNQDTLPHGGFGNLIALPLQKHRRGDGNSVFLDERGVPHEDQWAFLSSLRRIPRGQVEGVVREAEQRGRILGVRLPPDEEDERTPWTAPPSRRRKAPPIAGDLPRSLELVLGNEIYIAKERVAAGASKSAAAGCGVPEPRVLQNASHAAIDVRQAAHYRLRRGSRAPHRPSARVPRRRSSGTDRRERPADHSRRTLRRSTPGRRVSRGTKSGPAPRRGRDAEPRHRSPRRHDGLRQDGHCCLADRAARRQHARAGAPPPAARPMGPAALDISGRTGRNRSAELAADDTSRQASSTWR